MSFKKADNSVKILDVRLNSTSINSVLAEAETAVGQKQAFFVVTPNPEFLVLAQKDPEFKAILNRADLAIPDGFGLVLASRFLNTRPRLERTIYGADVVEMLLATAIKNNWRVGVVGARKGVAREQRLILERLRSRYAGLKIECLELVKDWQSRSWSLILAAQGMGEQEKWIAAHLGRAKAAVFMGIGGSLDFLTGFAWRPPLIWRKLGLGWLWRFLGRPRRHLPRVWRAIVVFGWLVVKEKFKGLKV
jgi:N-acetylglucosaminyldiphosphoundecaprenol N-acetyl-beta-D-mannosaminyltransferase